MKVLLLHSITAQPRQRLQNCALRHCLAQSERTRTSSSSSSATSSSATTATTSSTSSTSSPSSAVQHRYFGVPRQLWYGSRLSSIDLHVVVSKHIDHYVLQPTAQQHEAKNKEGAETETETENKGVDNVLNKIVADLRQLPYCVMIAGENGSTRRPLPFTAVPTNLKKNEFIVVEWNDAMYYNEKYDVVEKHDSVREAVGQRTKEERRSDDRLTLEHCLGEYGNVETLSEDYKCDKCNAKGTTKTKVDIMRLPGMFFVFFFLSLIFVPFSEFAHCFFYYSGSSFLLSFIIITHNSSTNQPPQHNNNHHPYHNRYFNHSHETFCVYNVRSW